VTDDRRILAEALAAARFEAIFRSCYPRVLAYVLRRCEGREVAEEVVSETFLIAWRRLEAVPLEPLPWLLGTARKVLGHRRRSERRRAAHLTVSSLEGVEVTDPGTPVAERLARRESLAAAFAALPDRDREILTLVAWEGLSPREGARVLGCSAAAFSLRLHRARRRLSKELAADGHPAGEDMRPRARARHGAAETE
jgi:RNA polymerase sigma-70 factor (ECF subfamily)